MTFLASTYDCKIDAKGRLVLPSKIKTNFPEDTGNEVVLRMAFEPCLILYPMVEFRKTYQKIAGLNEFNKEHRALQRNFFSSVQTVEIDSAGRILIPKQMLQYAGLEKDAMVVGTGLRVEIWNPERYNSQSIEDPDELSKLAEKYLLE
ncbi:division/cell wall cluster transcriptional repressor MraZ [Fulvivirga sedimenti]|uniref:Transcriptional regulator MraZ n=1 Tax=Fulvivirga sedimenti TaxID=2879465 RepID=A0A9X1HNN0_9BACT|nr:division/cell wall cluster transcriptional repressor MraZ [Fulvivirga sedimenti]